MPTPSSNHGGVVDYISLRITKIICNVHTNGSKVEHVFSTGKHWRGTGSGVPALVPACWGVHLYETSGETLISVRNRKDTVWTGNN